MVTLPAFPGELDDKYAITYAFGMDTKTVTEARANLYRIVSDAVSSHRPVRIEGKQGAAVLVAASDWEAIQETLFLLSVPGMRESLLEGASTPVSECSETLDWD